MSRNHLDRLINLKLMSPKMTCIISNPNILALMRESQVFTICKQQRHRSACALAQTCQHFSYSLIEKFSKTCHKRNLNFIAGL